MQEFKLENQNYIELCSLLKIMVLCDTGGQAKLAIAQGKVRVNGQVETRKRFKVPAGSVVEMAGEKVKVI